jgi:apolipoprotein N-acyltransferase
LNNSPVQPTDETRFTTPLVLPPWALLGLPLIAGVIIPLSFSPFDWWPLGFLAIALYYLCLQQATARQALQRGFAFGCGLFGFGASWIYVSIHDHSDAPTWVAVFITVGFVALMALYNGVHAWLWRRYARQSFPALGFAASWVLCEAFRGWFLTGFPWLFLGYAHVTSPFSGLAPILGVHGPGFVVALCGALLATLIAANAGSSLLDKIKLLRHQPALWSLVAVVVLSVATHTLQWTHPSQHAPVSVGMVQGNIPQDVKFDAAEGIQLGLNRYAELSKPLWQSDILLWPETAIPLRYQEQPELLAQLTAQARSHHTALITGIFYHTDLGLHNSVIVVGNGSGVWHKQKLVPFGEYVPLKSLLSNLLELFKLPLSDVSPGPAGQPLLEAAGLKIAPFICYEVVYADFVRQTGSEADLLLTISNDTWFGDSFGPHQHLQMAAMRARELGRYMVRATNNGVSAFINANGEIVAQTQQFTAETLQGSVLVYEGTTPFARFGSWPIWLLSLGIIGFNVYKLPRSN